MKITLHSPGKKYFADLSKPIDISIPLRHGEKNPNAFYAPLPDFSPLTAEDFIGDTSKGSPVNFFDLKINPHGNGTHTECVGHISKERYSINQCLQRFHFFAQVISVYPTLQENGDKIILCEQLSGTIKNQTEAIIIRTLPNNELKKQAQYSGHNPAYLHHEVTNYLRESGIQHLLIDLPSVDREEDKGALLAHKAFWQYPQNPRENCTITEMVYVPEKIKDGLYLMNMQIASLELDVSPSKILLFEFQE